MLCIRKDAILATLQSVPRKQRIRLNSRVNLARTQQFDQLLSRQASRAYPVVTLQINSKGGSFLCSQQICKTIEKSDQAVIGVVTGRAYSAAAFILQACHIRVGRPESKYLFHYNTQTYPVSIRPFMDTDAFKLFLDNKVIPDLEEAWAYTHELLLRRVSAVGKTDEDLHTLLRKDHILTAEEALDWGFIDAILPV